MRRTTYFTIANADGAPCVAASANGRCDIIAVMTNTEQGHELADAVCADLNTKAISTNRRLKSIPAENNAQPLRHLVSERSDLV